MRSRLFRLFLAVGMCASAAPAQEQGSNEPAVPAFTQQIDPAFLGVWTLNFEKSDFGGRPTPKPKMEQVNWTEHGFALAMVRADGSLYADGHVFDRGCTMIGVESDYSCDVKVVTPRHVRFRFKKGPAILRSVEIELLENNTLQMTHRVTPSEGPPYVEKTIWEREGREQPESASGARQESDETAKADVLKVSQQLGEAAHESDQAALDRILADRLSWITRGERLNKAQVITDYLSGNLHFKSFSHDNVVVNVFGNTAVMTGQSTSVLEYKGKLFDAPRLFTDVYVKMDGRWQLVVHHVSELAKP